MLLRQADPDPLWPLGEQEPAQVWRCIGERPEPGKSALRSLRIERVADRREYGLLRAAESRRAIPQQRRAPVLGAHLPPQRARAPIRTAAPTRVALARVTMRAAGGNLRAAFPRRPRVVDPGDCGFGAHAQHRSPGVRHSRAKVASGNANRVATRWCWCATPQLRPNRRARVPT